MIVGISFRTWDEARVLRGHAFLVIVAAALLGHGAALASSTHPLFDLSAPSGGPFPTDRFTVPDASQITGLRVALPKPDCAARPSDCTDLDLLNELDGFNLSPRLSIPFDGPIDLSTVTSANIFLVGLGSTLPGGASVEHVSGIDQAVWDPDHQTLYVESDEALEQHSRYVLVVTKNVLDPSGKEVKGAKEFLTFVDETITTSTGSPDLDAYRTALRQALTTLDADGIASKGQVVAASVFTTMSATASLEKMRDQIKAGTPAPADFVLGPGGIRTVFASAALTSAVFNRQTSANPAAPLSPVSFGIRAALDVIPGAVGSVAFGKYIAPDYRMHPGEYFPQVGTLSGSPSVQGTSEITFLLFLPSSPKPPAGYPVAIYGHGANTNKSSSAFVAAKMAEHGIATIAIDGPGAGFGPLGTYTLTFSDLTKLTFRAGGRGLDQNGDGRIIEGEGFNPAGSRAMVLGGRGDGQRQWAADHMQLVRVIEVGVDVDGDGSSDLDPSRIYYVGTSNGGRQGAVLLAVEPDARAGVLNDPMGSVEDRLTSSRATLAAALQNRIPSLINAPGIVGIDGVALFPQTPPFCNENLPLRLGAPYRVLLEDGSSPVIRSPVVNNVPGALDIQEALERAEWAGNEGNSMAYASHLRRRPLAGVPPKPVIVQFAYGDRVVPNPSTAAILRAGDLADRTTFYRSDLAFPSGNPLPNPSAPILYPHIFLQLFTDPALNARSLEAQEQIASFFSLDGPGHILDPFDGSQIIDPDPDSPIFEVPIVPPLPLRMDYPGSPILGALSASGILHDVTGGDDLLAFSQGRSLQLSANPSRGSILLRFGIPVAAATDIRIFDATGRTVCRIDAGVLAAGAHELTWDGRDEAGKLVAPGIYLVRVRAGALELSAKAVRIR